ncbi:MAG: MBL fold metallo-hydrolase [Syntrophomonadaceae bacterium]|nr:MBL fold metallo-hydrolase [Syntrophomonadaceae bacterium]
MKQKMQQRTRFVVLTILFILSLIILFTGPGCGLFQSGSQEYTTAPPSETSQGPPDAQLLADQLEVHFLNVGQADSILIQLPNSQTMLIDAGNNADGPAVVSYLRQQGIRKIDYLIGTHPHEDHIGGLDNVIKDLAIGQVYLPQITNNTKTFEDVLQAINAKSLTVTTAKAGVSIIDQENLKAVILAPGGTAYESLNDWSVVTRAQYGATSFLFTGDAEAQSEREMLASSWATSLLKSDVLKVSHHGSHSSTTQPFLNVVSPKYAVISVGVGNDYGHPHSETLTRLNRAGIEVYRTDQDGTLIFTSDGEKISIEKLAGPLQSDSVASDSAASKPVANNAMGNTEQFIGNKNSQVFHRSTCSGLPSEKNRVLFDTREKAVAEGYRPCPSCRP